MHDKDFWLSVKNAPIQWDQILLSSSNILNLLNYITNFKLSLRFYIDYATKLKIHFTIIIMTASK